MVTLDLFVSQVFLGCRILRYIFAAVIKQERLFAPLLIIPFNPAKITVVFFADGEGSKEFHKASFLTLLSNPSFCLLGVGEHYKNFL